MNSSNSINDYSTLQSFERKEKVEMPEVKAEPAVINKVQKVQQDDYFLESNIEKLSEKLSSALLYTKDASKVIAEMMLKRQKVELVA